MLVSTPVSSVPQVKIPFASVSMSPVQFTSWSRRSEPFSTLIPWPKVEVAVVDCTSRVFVCIPPAKVEVASTPVTMSC